MKDVQNKNLLFLHFYPDLMNLYGSYANLYVLRRLTERLGYNIKILEIAPGENNENNAPDLDALSNADFIFMGAGTERRQRFAMRDFVRYADLIRDLAADGVPMLFAGNAMELCGESVTTADGETFDGIALADFHTIQQSRRIVGDVYGYTDYVNHNLQSAPETPYRIPIAGFMNKSGIVTGVETPLFNALDMGFGNEREKGPEGFRENHVIGSELTGPLLVKNPYLLECIAAAILNRRGVTPPEEYPVDSWAEKGCEVTLRELDARCHKRK